MIDLVFNMAALVTKSSDAIGLNNIVDLKMSICNNASVDYFISSLSFGHLGPGIRVVGPSQISCQLSWDDYLDPGEQAFALKIPAGNSVNSDYLPLSGACYFTGAMPGRYTVSHSFFIQPCEDESLKSCLDSINLSGQTEFVLSGIEV